MDRRWNTTFVWSHPVAKSKGRLQKLEFGSLINKYDRSKEIINFCQKLVPRITHSDAENVDEAINNENIFAKLIRVRFKYAVSWGKNSEEGGIAFLSYIANCKIYERTFSLSFHIYKTSNL